MISISYIQLHADSNTVKAFCLPLYFSIMSSIIVNVSRVVIRFVEKELSGIVRLRHHSIYAWSETLVRSTMPTKHANHIVAIRCFTVLYTIFMDLFLF